MCRLSICQYIKFRFIDTFFDDIISAKFLPLNATSEFVILKKKKFV